MEKILSFCTGFITAIIIYAVMRFVVRMFRVSEDLILQTHSITGFINFPDSIKERIKIKERRNNEMKRLVVIWTQICGINPLLFQNQLSQLSTLFQNQQQLPAQQQQLPAQQQQLPAQQQQQQLPAQQQNKKKQKRKQQQQQQQQNQIWFP